MCAVRRTDNPSAAEAAQFSENPADGGGWGWYDEEYEEEAAPEEPPSTAHIERGRQQHERAAWFEETGEKPQFQIPDPYSQLLENVAQYVELPQRPHMPEPSGTAQLAAKSKSATYKRPQARTVDRSQYVSNPAPHARMGASQPPPEEFIPPDILMPPIPIRTPAQDALDYLEASAPQANPIPSSPWELEGDASVLTKPTEYSDQEDPLQPMSPIPDSPWDLQLAQTPYAALHDLLDSPADAAFFSPSPEPIRAFEPPPPPAPTPPPRSQHTEPVQQAENPLNAYKPRYPAGTWANSVPKTPPPDDDDLPYTRQAQPVAPPASRYHTSPWDEGIDDFFEEMEALHPSAHAGAAPAPARAAYHIGAFVAPQDIDSDTMMAGLHADALLREGERLQAMEDALAAQSNDPFDPAQFSLHQMPLRSAYQPQDGQEDDLDSTMMGSLDELPDWDDDF